MDTQKNSSGHKKKRSGLLVAAVLVFGMAAFVTAGISRVNAADMEYYRLSLKGTEIGIVESGQSFYNALAKARERIAADSDEIVYLDMEYELTKTGPDTGEILKNGELEEAVYQAALDCRQDTKVKAYTIKVNQFTVTLASREDVVALLEAAKQKYDTCDDFSVELVTDTSKELPGYTVRLQKKNQFAEKEILEVDAGIAAVTDKAQEESDESLKNLYFAEDIEIVETYVEAENIVPLEQAVSDVTKEKEKNRIYEVEAGDCLSLIAQKTETSTERIIALNELSGENALLQVGDELIVTVPEPELSVITRTEVTYEEDYTSVEYIDNDQWYTTREEVISQGTTGHHQVTDIVTSKNGIETSREQIAEVVMTEAEPTVIERGTITPPTYIKPISNGRFTSGFKFRWGRWHKGIDWACPTGTAVKASCSGTVVQAGWSSGYGYCITLSHPDGKKTRYAHLKKILVSNGQSVKQGEKIALSGNTGRSTGPHLHFEIIVNGSQVDPFKYLE